jgi:uncharacterized protein DUF6600/FecR-like protein
MSVASQPAPFEVDMGRLFGFAKFHHAIACCLVLAWLFVPSPAIAQAPDATAVQNVAADPPAHVSFVDGNAVLERDGQRDAAPSNMPLLAGDRIRTQNGRVEILFADNSTLHLDNDTMIDFESDDLVRLLAGRVRLAIPGRDREVSYRIDAPSASAVINQPGEYRMSILNAGAEGEIELAVLRGNAELVNDGGRTALRAGQRAYARVNAAPSYAYAFNSASWDSFDRWSETRRDQRLGVSTQYLPSEVQPYAPAFDQYGSWQYNTSYGYVWYPSVAVGWRPYYYGRWVPYRPYGWTWVGAGPWAWPTHHYGRWGFSAGSWFWIPGRTWGPAWVSWAYAPGYVSWCPLGWNNRAVLSFGFNFGYDPWRAWTVLPYGHFGHGYVHVNYVGGYGFNAHTRGAFVPRYTAPAYRGYAVPRSSTPIYVAGTARPRGQGSTVYTNLDPNASRVGQGGRRVIVGEPRSRVTEVTPGSPTTGERSRAVVRGVPAQPATSSVPSQPTYGTAVDRSRAATPATGGNTSVSDDRYARRPPPADSGDPRNATDSRTRAVPRSYPSYGTRAPEMPRAGMITGPGSVTIPRAGPEVARPAAPEYRPYGYGVERRAPGMDRPSAPPPPSSAPPAAREYHANPGANRAAPAPENRGGGSSQPQGGRSRGGQPSSGTATPRGRG